MKKVLSVLLAALMIMSVFSIVAFADSYQVIDFISIQGVVAPKAGAKPTYSANTNNSEIFHIYTGYGPVGDNIYQGVQWYDQSTSTLMDKNDTFQAGHQYNVTVYLAINTEVYEGCYMFPENSILINMTINGKEAFGGFIGSEHNYSASYWVSYTFPVVENEIESIAVTGVTAPAIGAKPAYKATVASAELYTVTQAYDSSTIKNGVEWYDVTASKSVKSTDTFVDGHAYSVTVYLRAKDEYAFPRIFNGNATLNGKSAVAGPADALAMSDYVQDFMVIYEFPAIGGSTTPVSFPDVPSNAWFYGAVQYCAQKEFISGYGNGKFGPADPLQRQDFVVIISRIAQADTAFYTYCKLKDVDMKAYYGPAVAWAEDHDIVHGYVNGKFGVGDKITREQVVTILYRFMGSPAAGSGNIMNGFPDRTKVSDFADEAMIWAVNNGIISGKNGKLAPQDNASRAEIATIIMHMDQKGMF